MLSLTRTDDVWYPIVTLDTISNSPFQFVAQSVDTDHYYFFNRTYRAIRSKTCVNRGILLGLPFFSSRPKTMFVCVCVYGVTIAFSLLYKPHVAIPLCFFTIANIFKGCPSKNKLYISRILWCDDRKKQSYKYWENLITGRDKCISVVDVQLHIESPVV